MNNIINDGYQAFLTKYRNFDKESDILTGRLNYKSQKSSFELINDLEKVTLLFNELVNFGFRNYTVGAYS